MKIKRKHLQLVCDECDGFFTIGGGYCSRCAGAYCQKCAENQEGVCVHCAPVLGEITTRKRI